MCNLDFFVIYIYSVIERDYAMFLYSPASLYKISRADDISNLGVSVRLALVHVRHIHTNAQRSG